jgi:hypothetical protein
MTPNNRLQRTALRAAADAGRSAYMANQQEVTDDDHGR